MLSKRFHTRRSGLHRLGFGIVTIGLLFLSLSANAAPKAEEPPSLSLPTVATLPPGTYLGPPKPWVQVNADAFGLGDPSNQTPPYQSEDAFEVVVFNGQLYVGMEGDNRYGARIWRTKAGVSVARDQTDWEQVVRDAFGNVGNNDHIDSLASFAGYLYASTAQSRYSEGTEVWRSPSGDPGTWTQVNVDGFGDFRNLNFKDMVVFTVDGIPWLCGGTMNVTRGPQVWCTNDGTTWVQKNGNWRNFGDVGYIKIWSTGVMDGFLYVGTECAFNGPCPGALWRTDGTPDPADPNRWRWEKVFEATADSRVDVLGVYDGHLYIGFDGGNGTEIWRSPTGDPGAWVQVNADGFGDPNNGRIIADAATVYNGALYVATLNQVTGTQVWRTTDGVTWESVESGGFGDPRTFAAQLIAFNGYLYAWATNYHTGQKVLRTKVPICQQQAINGPGTYRFDGVGAEIVFHSENLERVEVCLYPGAFPEKPVGEQALPRHYEIHPFPVNGTFLADVTLSYTAKEFAASGIDSEATIYLLMSEGESWTMCPGGQQRWDPLQRTVTCSGLTAFSTFALAGGARPAATAPPTLMPSLTPTAFPTPTSAPTGTPPSTPTPTLTPSLSPTPPPVTPTWTPSPTSTSPTPTPTPRGRRCPDFVDPPGVGPEDVTVIVERWRQPVQHPGWDPRFDLDGDGDVDIVDVESVVTAWGRRCR